MPSPLLPPLWLPPPPLHAPKMHENQITSIPGAHYLVLVCALSSSHAHRRSRCLTTRHIRSRWYVPQAHSCTLCRHSVHVSFPRHVTRHHVTCPLACAHALCHTCHLRWHSMPTKARDPQNEHPRCSFCRPRACTVAISYAPPSWWLLTWLRLHKAYITSTPSACYVGYVHVLAISCRRRRCLTCPAMTHLSHRLHGPPVPPFAQDTQNEHHMCLFCVSRARANVVLRHASMVCVIYTPASRTLCLTMQRTKDNAACAALSS
jgi:hypothetical protein